VQLLGKRRLARPERPVDPDDHGITLAPGCSCRSALTAALVVVGT
jgi:hypothetical protein